MWLGWGVDLTGSGGVACHAWRSLPISNPRFDAPPQHSTPPAPGYDIASLEWNSDRTRNRQNQYGYTGRAVQVAEVPSRGSSVLWRSTEHSLWYLIVECLLEQPSLRCSACRQWFPYAELGEGLLPAGFLPFQRNYEFCCAWCPGWKAAKKTEMCRATKGIDSPVGSETLVLTEPLKFEAIADAMVRALALVRIEAGSTPVPL
jgi:hypothetical protein